MFILELGSTAAFAVVAVVTHPEVSFGISDEEKC